MNRGDLRLVIAILFTALTASVITVMVYAHVTSADTLEERVEQLRAEVDMLLATKQGATWSTDHGGTVPAVPLVPPVATEPPPPPRPPEVLDPSVPPVLDRAMIDATVAKVKSRLRACGPQTGDKGIVKINFQVDPSGKLFGLQMAPDTSSIALGSCVITAMRHAEFPQTQRGGTFTYPFVF